MTLIFIVLILLLTLVVSSALVRVLPVPLPLPLVQIALGAALASVANLTSVANLGVELDPQVFFLLFLPPLLFLDGWRIPKQGLLHDRVIVVEMAFGLVVFTVVGLGYLVHRLIPAIPLAVSFALSAILSPTDPIAVAAIGGRVPMPARLLHILEGESLLNDASGLVCMRFAVAAALTGVFSLPAAIGTFCWLATGGIAAGVGVTAAIAAAKNWVSRHYGEESGSQIVISLLIPFAAYLLAERIHASGILAAVAAGITMSYAEQSGQALGSTRIRRSVVWDLLQFTANGVIFILLGEQLPQIVSGAEQVVRQAGHHQPIWLLWYVFVICFALAALRFLWVWASLRLTLLRKARRGAVAQGPGWRLIAATSLAGVRGAVTLAGVLTLPLVLADGRAFPARELAIFLAAGTIILSLVAASALLPRLLHGLQLPPESSRQAAEDRARIAAAEAAIRALERSLHARSANDTEAERYTDVGARILEWYRHRIDSRRKFGADNGEGRRIEAIERELRLVALRAERDEFYRMAHGDGLPDEVVRKLVREIDLLEARLGAV